jgi:hypothetical protein
MIPHRLINEARSLYLAEFGSVRARVPDAYLEPALRTADGTLATEGPLKLPYRADLINKDTGKSITVDSASRARMANFAETAEDVQISLQPFLWDYVTFVVKISGSPDWLRIREWFFRWFDPDDTNALNDEGFYGVVHYLSEPHPSEGGATITVDFGSAPVEAFDDCIDTLVALRPERIEIG